MKKIIYLSLIITLLCCKTEKIEKEYIDSPFLKDTNSITFEVNESIILDSIIFKKVSSNIKLDTIEVDKFNAK
ncbi:hypothetical protein [Polaribacter sp. 20A6]|uniref:hypothetical protein n=1 Tax=Polaribacter sp. 20A6 TaxID=2687289 RepID=UPI0013FE3200|nr:hypothetical protein [Polaribacter sp. 20A6]